MCISGHWTEPSVNFVFNNLSLSFSMQLFNYLAKSGDKCGLEAGMCISVAWNVFESVTSLETPGINLHIINRQLSNSLVQMVQK